MPEGATSAISAILVDDEQLARDELAFLLKDFADVEIVATGKNGLEAVRLIEDLEKKGGPFFGRVVILATAHPAKFLEIVSEVTGATPEIPANIQKALKLPKQAVRVPNDLKALEDFLRGSFSGR